MGLSASNLQYLNVLGEPVDGHRMDRNVEIKAYVGDSEAMQALVYDLTDTMGQVLDQEDTFFAVPKGRLKLRVLKNQENGQLIYYERENGSGPCMSNYYISDINDAASVKETLMHALGLVGVIRKRRRLSMCGQTRIHLDNVEGLGDFLELEVVLDRQQTQEEGQKIAEDIMHKLKIEKEQLIADAYMDLLLRSNDKNANITPTTTKLDNNINVQQ